MNTVFNNPNINQFERTTIDGFLVYCRYDKIVKIENLKENPKNPNKHPEDQIELLAEILKVNGWRQPITVSLRSGYIVKGHGRLAAAKLANCSSVPVEFQNYKTDEDEIADLVADNRIAELSDVDNKLLAELLNGYEFDNVEITGYRQSEFDDLMDLIYESPSTKNEDDEISLPVEPFTAPGDLWVLCGETRLVCGDCKSESVWDSLMQNEKADLLITDPPYNVDYQGGTKDKLKIQNDKQTKKEFYDFLCNCFSSVIKHCKAGASVYIWHADSERVSFQLAAEQAGVSVKQNLIWNKNTFVLGRQDYQWKHEPCLYGWVSGGSHYFTSQRNKTTVLDYDKPLKNGLHPTMKPVALFEELIQNSTPPMAKRTIILDPFAGSGTTAIAAHKNKQVARLIEIDPRYCDVIVRRFLQVFGYSNADAICYRNGVKIKHNILE